ncbi:hypothetical protein HGA64_04235 [Candidatus Falkowbacteria bacterium]|nr:hypothetical protein [Candidatus Falkowbacteria bacterium]
MKGIAVDPRYDDVVAPETVQTAAFTSSASTTATTTVISTSSRVYVSNTQIIAANTCTSWTYSDWSPCSPWGNQTRNILSSQPANCSGGNFVLSQSCGAAATSSSANLATSTAIVATATNMILAGSSTGMSLDDALLSAAYFDFGKNVNLTCKPWVNKVLTEATNASLALPFLSANNYAWDIIPGGRVLYKSMAIENVGRADIVQFNMANRNNLPHTAIIAAATPTGMVWIHSNWQKTNTVSVDFITYAYFNYLAGAEYSIYHIY